MVVKYGLNRFISHKLVEKTIILLKIVLYVGNPLVNRIKLEFNKGFDLNLQGFQLIS